MPALLFGSISTLSDTSELQRRAYNESFRAHELGWSWSREEYRNMLAGNGGVNRIARYAAERGQNVNAVEVHATKTRLFREVVEAASIVPRPGVVDTVQRAKSADAAVGLVTTTSAGNADAVLRGLSNALSLDVFDLVVSIDDTAAPKPDPGCYRFGLAKLGVPVAEAVAVEDNIGGLRAALGAGVRCVAFPNANTAAHDFAGAVAVVDELDPADVLGFVNR